MGVSRKTVQTTRCVIVEISSHVPKKCPLVLTFNGFTNALEVALDRTIL